MGILDSIDSVFSNAVSSVSDFFTGGPTFPDTANVGGLNVPSGFFPPLALSSAYAAEPANAMIAGPLVQGMRQYVIPKIAAAFPTLLAYLQSRNIPWNKGVQWLWSITKKFGPAAVAGIVGQAVVSELIQWSATKQAKRRRMNVANVKALRRGLRRMKGFERLAHRVSSQLSRTAHRGRSYRRHVVERCNVCRKSPCRC